MGGPQGAIRLFRFAARRRPDPVVADSKDVDAELARTKIDVRVYDREEVIEGVERALAMFVECSKAKLSADAVRLTGRRPMER